MKYTLVDVLLRRLVQTAFVYRFIRKNNIAENMSSSLIVRDDRMPN